jgi:hypothetical protein
LRNRSEIDLEIKEEQELNDSGKPLKNGEFVFETISKLKEVRVKASK